MGKKIEAKDAPWQMAADCKPIDSLMSAKRSHLLINRTPYQVQQHTTGEQGKKTKTCRQKGGKTE